MGCGPEARLAHTSGRTEAVPDLFRLPLVLLSPLARDREGRSKRASLFSVALGISVWASILPAVFSSAALRSHWDSTALPIGVPSLRPSSRSLSDYRTAIAFPPKHKSHQGVNPPKKPVSSFSDPCIVSLGLTYDSLGSSQAFLRGGEKATDFSWSCSSSEFSVFFSSIDASMLSGLNLVLNSVGLLARRQE